MTTWVLATANPHKAREMRDLLAGLGVEVVPRPGDIAEVNETADSLEGNALLKARAIAAATGRVAVADDTGIFVDALDGRPGVRSARFAGDDASDAENVAKLLAELAPVPGEKRRARFRTVIAVAAPDGTEITVVGELEGRIIEAPRGANGFGYDPVFASAVTGERTLAEISPAEKNLVSHRSRALRELARVLREDPRAEGLRARHP